MAGESVEAAMARFDERLKHIEQTGNRIEMSLARNYVTKDEFSGLERRVNGMSSFLVWGARIIIGGVLAAMLALVLKDGLS